jgi:hypothetical protein
VLADGARRINDRLGQPEGDRGDTDGMTAAGDSAPWEEDDAPAFPVVSDTVTQARCLWVLM